MSRLRDYGRAGLCALGLCVALGLTVAVPARAVDTGVGRDRDAVPESPRPKVMPPVPWPDEGRWKLGVTVDVLDVGVRIRDVVPRSAAARVGLERSDIIVTVGGYQVGRVDGRDYSLEDELQRRANERGEVLLLVQDRRSGKLMSIDVRLDRSTPRPREAVIRGEAHFRERMALPPDAELRVELRRRTSFSSDTVARQTYRNLGGPPYRFELRYPTDRTLPEGRYEVVAEIRSHGNRLFVSDEPYRVRPGIDEPDVVLLLRRDGPPPRTEPRGR